MSLVGARISSIIMLSRAKELRFSVLDLSELKERRLQVTARGSGRGAMTVMGRSRVGRHGRKTNTNTKRSRGSVTSCNLQGTFWLFLTRPTKESVREEGVSGRPRGGVETLRSIWGWKMKHRILRMVREGIWKEYWFVASDVSN